MDQTKPEIPKEARIHYGARHKQGSGHWWVDDEDEARHIAGSGSSDGSGQVLKRARWGDGGHGDTWRLSVSAEYIEELDPVVEFNKSGEWIREQYLLKRDCKHETTTGWRLESGAGCQKDYAKYCTICGQAVDWQ